MTDDTGKSKDATRRTVLLGFGGAVGAAFATDAPPAAAQMAQGHREARPGTQPLAEIRVIERSNLLSGRLAGLLLADQGAEVFVERAGATPAADQRVALDDAYFDRGKIALPPGAAADGASADIVIVDGAAQFARGPRQILLRIMTALPGDEVYGYLPHDCSEDLIKAVVGFFSNMSVSGPILNRPVIYTPLPLPSIYCAVNGAVAAVSALVDRLRTGLGREIIASRLAGGLSAIGALSMTSKGLPDFLEPIVIGGLPPGLTPEQFHTFVADAIRDPERQMWLERRFAPFSAPYRARDGRWILPMAGPNARLSRRLFISVMLAVFARIEPALRKSITFDNDTAFAQHALLRTMRAMTTWFCDAYASWQKGGVENANGRLRRWLPRQIDIDKVSDEEIQDIVMTANLTPRKCLGFKTPLQAILKELGKDVQIRFA